MKIRVVSRSRGIKGVDWERYFLVQIKTFLVWSNWKEFKTIDEAAKLLDIFNVIQIEYTVF